VGEVAGGAEHPQRVDPQAQIAMELPVEQRPEHHRQAFDPVERAAVVSVSDDRESAVPHDFSIPSRRNQRRKSGGASAISSPLVR